jgi:phosphomannomutase
VTAEALRDSGVDVVDIGRCGTEMVYFATFHLGLEGGIMVTASHNPADYNGLKLVREEGRPISADTGLQDIERLVLEGKFSAAARQGSYQRRDIPREYVEHLLGYVDPPRLRPFKVVTNPGNGGAGPILDLLEPHLPLRLRKLHHQPDGTFPTASPTPCSPRGAPPPPTP